MKPVIWMFSGQGSQYFNMGRDLYESDPVFRDWMNRCNAVVRRFRQASLLDAIYRPADRSLSADFIDLHDTHPALFSVQYSLAKTLLSRGMKPDLMLGYSLGEIIALSVGNALSLEAAIEALLGQANLFTTSARPGAMLAVLAPSLSWDPQTTLFADTWLAACNTPEHFVVSGVPDVIDQLQNRLQSREILYFRLPVPIAFHSPLIDSLEHLFHEKLGGLQLGELGYPLVSTACMSQMTHLPARFCWDVIRRPVRFQESIARLEARGPATYVDLGPSGTLAGFLRNLLSSGSKSSVYPLMTPFNRGGETLRRIEKVSKETGQA
jgi:acyl transferase domain-containing protein